MTEIIDGEAIEVTDPPAVAGALEVRERGTAMVARDEISVADLLQQSRIIEDVMRQAMKQDVHYGKIPGVNKPSLLKPGAEKLNVLFRLAPSYKSEKTWHDDGHLTVTAVCTLTHIPTSLVVAEGEGLCTTRESRYAWRQAERTCPNCGQPQVRKGRARGNNPANWYCWQKMGGCGQTWALDSEQGRIFESMETGRVANPDLADTYNTVLKMADKRALLAAVLNGTAASDVFTQDMEDSGAAGDVTPSPSAGSGASTVADGAPAPEQATVMPAAFKGNDATARIMQALGHVDPTVDWPNTWEAAIVAHYGKAGVQLNQAQTAEAWTRLANVAAKLGEGGDFPPPVATEIRAVFAEMFGGVAVEVVYHEPADDAPLAGQEIPENGDDDIPFGVEA